VLYFGDPPISVGGRMVPRLGTGVPIVGGDRMVPDSGYPIVVTLKLGVAICPIAIETQSQVWNLSDFLVGLRECGRWAAFEW